MDIVINKGIDIPAPEDRYHTGISSKIRQMEIGDSFVVTRDKQNAMISAFKQVGMRCTTRKIDDATVRVWRTA